MFADPKFATTLSGGFLLPLTVLIVFAILAYTVRTLQQMRVAVAEIRQVKKEVLPNGGASLRDSVNRIEAEQASAKAEAAEVARKLRKHLKKAKANQATFKQMQQDWPFTKAA